MEPDQFREKAASGGDKHPARGRVPAHILPIAASLAGLWLLMLFLHAGAANKAIYMAARTATSPLKDVAHAFTVLGNSLFLHGLAIAVALVLVVQRRVWAAASLALLATSGKLLADLMKVGIALPRPDSHMWLVKASGYTFPSGHAAHSMIVYLSIALLLTRMGTTRSWLVGAAVLLSALIGASRVVLGVHWPADVVAGWSFGAAWALLCCSAALKLEDLKRDAPSVTASE